MPTKNFWTHEIPTRKNVGPTNTRCHNGTRPTRPTIERGPQNLAHSYKSIAKHVLIKTRCSLVLYRKATLKKSCKVSKKTPILGSCQ